MSVGLMVGYNWWTIGEGSLFNSFFSTIYVRLENNEWGSRYPVIMNKLYWGDVPFESVERGIEELLSIQEELKNFSLRMLYGILKICHSLLLGEIISQSI